MEPSSSPPAPQGLVTAPLDLSPRSIHSLLSNNGPDHVIAILTSDAAGPISVELINALFHLVRALELRLCGLFWK